MKVGYARVSSSGQNLQSQIELLEKAGCEKIFTEKKSGKRYINRIELQKALNFVKEGDVFIVTRLDRCSRSVLDLYNILETLNKKQVAFIATEQQFDTSTSYGRLMIGLLSIVSAFETDLRAERQADGIASAKKRGIKFGRLAKFDFDKVNIALKMRQQKFSNQQIADKFKIGKSTLFRWIAKYKKEQKCDNSTTLFC